MMVNDDPCPDESKILRVSYNLLYYFMISIPYSLYFMYHFEVPKPYLTCSAENYLDKLFSKEMGAADNGLRKLKFPGLVGVAEEYGILSKGI